MAYINREFISNFLGNAKTGNRRLMAGFLLSEIATLVVYHKKDFLNVFKKAGITTSLNPSDVELVELFFENICNNKNLKLGTAFLIAHKNKFSGADGAEEISSNAVGAVVGAVSTALGKGFELGNTAVEKKRQKEAFKQGLYQDILGKKEREAKAKAEAEAKKRKQILLALGGVALLGVVVFAIVKLKKK